MAEYLLAVPDGYDPNTQAIVGMFAASLDDQARRLRETVAGLGVEHLEWQERPGRNTIGMLMAHLAAGEVGVFCAVVPGLTTPADAKRVSDEHLGFDTEGIIPLGGTHPESLKGCDLAGYVDLLARARSATHDVLKTWQDPDLDRTISPPGITFSHRFMLYRFLDHFAGHLGQISSLMHFMRDHEVPGLPEARPVF